ncbi:acyl-CoA thioesterase [Cyclobacterium marinum]|uniref:acyl-CoA thioesterase n=1 Tax=Cyclobacterium marinum TaxID=104 RepID=UPI0011EEA9E7|nr:acyl-CoA thioesterase [Cyclobacterium marinum]MBI0397569.1 acyl-CoA thioesterase [Cyclobacterium marinum]|tara:strand:- start:58490 stop:59056 length:567 start_codon:yes stop_codon:yes gene_type:complete
MSASLSARPASFSRVTITELMIPSYANFGGKIHGGILLSMMDKVAYTAATKHSGAYCVTVSVDTVDFLQPVEVGELVSLKASVNHVGNSSMIIGIKVISENVKTGVVKHTNTCYFTMVAKGEDDKPTPVPPLLLETRTDVRRFVEAIKRKKYKSEYGAILKELKRTWDQEAISTMLQGQRCEVSLDIK